VHDDDFSRLVKVFDLLHQSLLLLRQLVHDDEDDVAFRQNELLDDVLSQQPVLQLDLIDPTS
jgi:hypothetical protein